MPSVMRDAYYVIITSHVSRITFLPRRDYITHYATLQAV